MLSNSIYSEALQTISKYDVKNWPVDVERVNIKCLYNLDMWTENMPSGEKYHWAILTNVSDTSDYRIMKRMLVNE